MLLTGRVRQKKRGVRTERGERIRSEESNSGDDLNVSSQNNTEEEERPQADVLQIRKDERGCVREEEEEKERKEEVRMPEIWRARLCDI